MRVEASFVGSAAGPEGFPKDGLVEIALVGRSNVGKSSLINALARQPIARTSAAPGKTRLANFYRVTRGSAAPFYLVDLPGYGFARGDRSELEVIAAAFFAGAPAAVGARGPGPASDHRRQRAAGTLRRKHLGALLLVDGRHPGLESDARAWRWLQAAVASTAIVATKIDKLARGERIRALRDFESVLEHPVLPVSSATGEGMDELWKLIDTLTKAPRKKTSG